MILLYASLALIISFYLLAHICDDYFVIALDKVANKLKMSSDVAGATLMAIGSSAPEFFVSMIAVLKPGDYAAIGLGTIVGSALFNLLVIIGVSAIVKNTVLTWQPVFRDGLFYVLSILVLLWVFQDGQINLLEACSLIFLYVIYVIFVMNWQKILPYDAEIQNEEGEEEKECKKSAWQRIFTPFEFILSKIFLPNKYYVGNFFISILLIGFLSWVLVESAIVISTILHIPQAIIALTVLAIGTSMPDLISSVIVAKQGRGSMAICNALGSNIFDILIGLGVPWLIIIFYTEYRIQIFLLL